MNKSKQMPNTVHSILSRSYSVYLFSVIAGIIIEHTLELYFSFPFYNEIGFFVMTLGTLLVYWAQSTSSRSKKNALRNKTGHRNFALGPYKYTRNPTHVGLMLMTLGFGILIGSFFVIILTLFAFITSKLVFLPAEEKLLEDKYGEDYTMYKKKVHPWL